MSLTGKAVKIVTFGLATTLLVLQPFRAEAATVSCHWEPGGTVVTDGQASEADPIRVCEFDDDGSGGYDPGGGDGYGGGGGGDGGGMDTAQYCSILRMTKPSGCEGPKNIAGANFGEDKYPLGSGLRNAIGAIGTYGIGLNPAAKTALANALAQHTAALASQTIPLNDANGALVTSLGNVCVNQWRADMGHSYATDGCFALFRRLSGEASGNGDFGNIIINFVQSMGVSLGDLGLPQTAINWLAPENSLQLKFTAIESQAQCNVWYSEMQANGC